MKNKVMRPILFRFNHYKDIERELEKMAGKGLFLEKVGSYFWTFQKAEPKKMKYAVTYFSEASIFNPSATDNQQVYFDLAKESGWNFVDGLNQMQIFCNEDEHAIPFETDEREKFENIKKCMRKNFLPSTVILSLLFLYNLIVQYRSFKNNPVDFLAEASNLFIVAIMVPAIIYLCYILFTYFFWCKQCERSISIGGGCIEKINKYQKIVDVAFISYVFILAIWGVHHIFQRLNFVFLLLSVIYIPILLFVFRFSIYYLKKKNKSAMTNRVISFSLLAIVSFAYLFFILVVVIKFDLSNPNKKPFRTVAWQVSPTVTRDYKIYQDDIPLKCEDLYGALDYDNYSYEKDVKNTLFLTRREYRQDALPGRNSPREIAYEVIEPKFNFVYNIVIEAMKKVPEWSDEKIEAMDNGIFNTEEAYQFYYDNRDYSGDYLLVYKNKVILLKLEEPVTKQQATVIKEKLKVN